TKDGLTTGDPLKIISGTELNAEFNAIQTAVNSKANTNSPTLTGVPAAPTAAQGTNTTQLATTAFVEAEAVLTASQVTAVAVAADVVVTTAFGTADTALGVRIDDITFAQASTAELEAGTETDRRSYSPADLVTSIEEHAPNTGLGEGQAWQDMILSRSSGVIYTNSTGRSISVAVCGSYAASNTATFEIAGQRVGIVANQFGDRNGTHFAASYIIPNGVTYEFTATAGITEWWELR
ncbi:MAG: hypothetical protein JKY52_20940, partial [Flavobacteriales bacterium]|nr:hypothetical protein [Flavobacteriales bacterium]